MKKHYHFIAIGGAVMHQLALHLHQQGHIVSGSDDAIYDPAKTALQKHGILPETEGWFEEKINNDVDVVILGMHAKKDNPELLKALALGLSVYSFPEFIYQASKDKKRVVVAGSHGKTTTTSMIMHVLKSHKLNFDYLVGAQIEGFDYMVKTSDDAEIIVIEGDEYLSSPLDMRSKFLHYQPHIAVLTGIAWDHINVFPTFDSYLNTFEKFIQSVKEDIIFYAPDEHLQSLVKKVSAAKLQAYEAFNQSSSDDMLEINYNGHIYPVNIFGKHNMANLHAAKLVCNALGIEDKAFFESIASFKGAAKRMECIYDDKNQGFTVYKDFAHAPSKVEASVKAIRERYPERQFVAALELHTFSSLQQNFIHQYAGSLDLADKALLFVDEEALRQKNRPPMDSNWLIEQFGRKDLKVFTEAIELIHQLKNEKAGNTVVLMMSSGQWGGYKPEEVFQPT